MHETHKNDESFKNKTDEYAIMIRFFLLTYKDSRGRTCLHNACKFGDKNFVTMIVMEAVHLGRGTVDLILDVKDND